MRIARWNRLFLLMALLLALVGWQRSVVAAESGGIFANFFGGDYKVTGGSMYVWSEKKAILIRDYATILLKGKRPNEWRRIRARNIIFFTDTNKLYAEGNVLVEDNSGTFLSCERLYFDNRSFKGRARNVRMRSTDEEVNTTSSVQQTDVTLTRPGLVADNASPLDDAPQYEQEKRMRMNIQTDDLRIVSKDHYEATGVTASPSNYARPHWAISSKAVHMRRGEKVEGFNNLVKIGNVPVFYLPYVVYDLKYRWPYYRTTMGQHNRQGFYWLNRLGWIFDHSQDEDEQGRPVKHIFQLDKIFVDGDLRLNRGPGFGSEVEYSDNFLGKGKGDFRYYQVIENMTGHNEDTRRADEDNEYPGNQWASNPKFTKRLYQDQSRYLLEWWHRQEFTDQFDLRLQTHYFSDRDFYKEYFLGEWSRDQEKLTNGSLRYIADLFQTEMVSQIRVNDFRTEQEYLPEWRFTLPGLRFWQLPLFLESQTNIGMVRKQSDVMLDRLNLLTNRSRTQDDGNTPWIGRAHNLTELAIPVDLGPVSLKGHGGGFMTGYTTTYNNNYGDAPSKLNMAGVWGVDASSRYYGYFKNNMLRHLIEPSLGLIGHEAPVVSRDDLYNVDSLDNYRESHMVTYGLYQALQTKTRLKNGSYSPRNLFALNVAGGVILDQDEADKYNQGNRFSNVYVNAGWYPLAELALYGGVSYSPARTRMDSASVGADYWFSKKLRVYLNHAYSAGTYSDSNADNVYGTYDIDNTSNLTTAAVRTQLWNKHSHYSLEYALSYQWNENANGVLASDGVIRGGVEKGIQSQRISLIRDLDTFQLSLNWVVDYTDGGSNKVSVGLKPVGWVGPRAARDDSDTVLEDRYGRYANPVAQKAQQEDTSYNTATPAWR